MPHALEEEWVFPYVGMTFMGELKSVSIVRKSHFASKVIFYEMQRSARCRVVGIDNLSRSKGPLELSGNGQEWPANRKCGVGANGFGVNARHEVLAFECREPFITTGI